MVQMAVVNFIILRKRGDLRLSICTLMLMPFYRYATQVFRFIALLQNAMQYTPYSRISMSISRREAGADVPPLPPMIHGRVDWKTVWQPGVTSSSTGVVDEITRIANAHAGRWKTEEDSIRGPNVMRAYVVAKKLETHISAHGFPRNKSAKAALDDVFISLRNRVNAMTGVGNPFALVEALDLVAARGMMSFVDAGGLKATTLENLGEIAALLDSAGYPKTHSKVKGSRELVVVASEMVGRLC